MLLIVLCFEFTVLLLFCVVRLWGVVCFLGFGFWVCCFVGFGGFEVVFVFWVLGLVILVFEVVVCGPNIACLVSSRIFNTFANLPPQTCPRITSHTTLSVWIGSYTPPAAKGPDFARVLDFRQLLVFTLFFAVCGESIYASTPGPQAPGQYTTGAGNPGI
jgi:hypothetical protein